MMGCCAAYSVNKPVQYYEKCLRRLVIDVKKILILLWRQKAPSFAFLRGVFLQVAVTCVNESVQCGCSHLLTSRMAVKSTTLPRGRK